MPTDLQWKDSVVKWRNETEKKPFLGERGKDLVHVCGQFSDMIAEFFFLSVSACPCPQWLAFSAAV